VRYYYYQLRTLRLTFYIRVRFKFSD